MTTEILEHAANESFPTIDRVSEVKYLSVDSKPVLGPVEIVEKCSKIEDLEEAKKRLREDFIECGLVDEDIIQQGINSLETAWKAEENVFNSEKCIQKLKSIQSNDLNEGQRIKQVIKFVDEEIFSKNGNNNDKEIFIEYELYNHFTLDKFGTKKIKEHCEGMLKPKKASKRSNRSKNTETNFTGEENQEVPESVNKDKMGWNKYTLPTGKGWYELDNTCIVRKWETTETDDRGKEYQKLHTAEVSRTPFVIFGKTKQLDDGTVYYGFRYKCSGTQKEIMIKKTDLQPKNKLKETLAKYDINVTDEMVGETEDFISRYIHKFGEQLDIVKTNTANGWNEDCTEFYQGERIITVDKIGKIHSTIETEMHRTPFHEKGTLEGWCKSVEPVLQHQIARFSIYDGMGAPLFKVLRVREQQMTVFHGKTGTGKSTLAFMVSSTMGKPEGDHEGKGLAFIVGTTEAGMLAHAAGLNDMPVNIEEATGEEKAKLTAAASYNITNGSDKIRAQIDGKLRNDVKAFRVQAQVTCERPLRDYIKHAGGKYRINDIGGEADVIPKGNGKLVSDLKDGIHENYGFFFPLYIQKIVNEKERIKVLYEQALSKIDSNMSGLPEESKGPAGRTRLTFAAKIVAGYLCEEIFENIGIKRKSQKQVEDIVNYFFNKCVIESPIEPEWKQALRYLSTTIVSERNSFYIISNDANENKSEEFIRNYVGNLSRNQASIIGTKLHEILEKGGYSGNVTKDWITLGITNKEKTIVVGRGSSSSRTSGYEIVISKMNEVLQIEEEDPWLKYASKYEKIRKLAEAIVNIWKCVSLEQINGVFGENVSEYVGNLVKQGVLITKPDGTYTLHD
jgi:putative DNA primase/helicase